MIMNRKLVFLIGALLLGVFLLNACSPASSGEQGTPPPTVADADVITMKYAGYLAPDHLQETIPAWYAKELEERTGGRVKIELFHGSSLGALEDFPEMLKGKVADISLITVVQPEFRDGMWEVEQWPFTSNEDMIISWAAFNVALQNGLLLDLDSYKVMWTQKTPPKYIFLADKKVTSMEDFRGLKISGVSGIWVDMPELLGATSVAVPGPDAYMALERGVVDGRVSMPDYILSQQLQEVVNYVPWFPITGCGGFAVAMTRERWDSLPGDVQLIMEQLNKEAQFEWFSRYYISTQEYRALLEETGIEVYDISEEEKERWKKAIQPLVDGQVAKYEAAGMPIKEVLEAYSIFNK
jgi:TRAP-type C4-dicarboxylate transport system substrate-binding protein